MGVKSYMNQTDIVRMVTSTFYYIKVQSVRWGVHELLSHSNPRDLVSDWVRNMVLEWMKQEKLCILGRSVEEICQEGCL